MRYSIETVPNRSVIILRVQEDRWSPDNHQVEISESEANNYVDLEKLVRWWRWVEFEPRRLGHAYLGLASILATHLSGCTTSPSSPMRGRADVAAEYYNQGYEGAFDAF